MSGPYILASDEHFRLVRVEDGNKVSHVMELPDGADALGVERWREVSVPNKGPMTVLFNYVIKTALREQSREPK